MVEEGLSWADEISSHKLPILLLLFYIAPPANLIERFKDYEFLSKAIQGVLSVKTRDVK
jgi:hypothetical protein